jgi:hypothetical protein
MVNEAFARQFLRGASVLGRTIRIRGLGGEVIPRAIVGIARLLTCSVGKQRAFAAPWPARQQSSFRPIACLAKSWRELAHGEFCRPEQRFPGCMITRFS